MGEHVLELSRVDRSDTDLVGAKAAHLGDLTAIPGLRVPDGFCVTTGAYRRVIGAEPSVRRELDLLSDIDPADQDRVSDAAARVRAAIGGVGFSAELVREITGAIEVLGTDAACAVRSSATGEDSEELSFAGQLDTALDVRGVTDILEAIRSCWASLFTDRAVVYRLRHGRNNRTAEMAVLVQHMVLADASGVMFTADPITSNRKRLIVEAVFGLGDVLVAGHSPADRYEVADETVDTTSIAHSAETRQDLSGRTEEIPVASHQHDEPVLTEPEVRELARLGRQIEAHFGAPQDIEWSRDADGFHILQSRPITTLFPAPTVDDDRTHVFLSVGHGQMMTEAMRPLGLSIWQHTTRAPMVEAGGRLFVDITLPLATPEGRAGLLNMAGRSDPLIGDALQTIIARSEPAPGETDGAPSPLPANRPAPAPDPAVVEQLMEASERSLDQLKRSIAAKSGPELVDFIIEDIGELQRLLFDPPSHLAIMAGFEAAWWLNDRIEDWLGERNAADMLARSAPHNVTADMGRHLLDVADAIRPHPEVVAFLGEVSNDDFLARLPHIPGGTEAHDAITSYLDLYGMRCVGEIDITRPRWVERPSALLPAILRHVAQSEPGAAARQLQAGREDAERKQRELLAQISALDDGEHKAADAREMIDRIRSFTGYREYPKYRMVSRYFVYKQALLTEANRLAEHGVLPHPEDIFYLRLEEIREVLDARLADAELIDARRRAFERHQTFTPPRVITSDGEVITGAYRHTDVPEGALAGLAVSTGTVDGRARVVLDMADGDLEPDDILVTRSTDPSWSPLFLGIKGLVTEVGGLMTHGSVIAREYGLPAVVGVERATELIEDGMRIRVNGTDGYIQILEE